MPALGLGLGLALSPSLDSEKLSLDLQFATDKTLTARKGPTPTFTRANGATEVGSDGLIRFSPENLILYSNNVGNAAWTKVGGTVATSAETINGLVAEVFNEDLTTGTHRFYRVNDGFAGITSTLSLWLKAAGRRYVCINVGTSGPSGDSKIVLDLIDQVVVVSATGVAVNIQIEGNGWARYSLTFIPRIDSGTMPIQSNFSSTSVSENGTGLNGAAFYVAGQQFERSSTARTYIPTTTAQVFGARFDHDPVTLACKGLLIEEQRTNLTIQSQAFDNAAYSKAAIGVAAATITANNDTAPDGTLTADLVNFSATTAIDQQGQLFRNVVTATAGQNITLSIYMRVPSGTATVFIGLTELSPLTGQSVACNVTTTWQRFSITRTVLATTSMFLQIGPVTSAFMGQTTVQPAASVLLWGAQFEVGAFPTSYIPTTGAAVVRSADVCSITGGDFTSFYNQSEGTFFTSGIAKGMLVMASSGINSDQVAIPFVPSIQRLRFDVANAGVYTAQVESGIISEGSFNKIAGSYAANDARSAFNGTLGTPDTSVTVPINLTTLHIGKTASASLTLNGTVARIQYFRKRLPDAKLQALTT